jgi:probable rRNA maturation factor
MSFKIYGLTYEVEKKLLAAAAKEAFLYLDQDFEVNLRFVSEARIQELNRIYRRKDKVTNVLSFSPDPVESGGDVVICYKELKKEAKEWKLSISQAAAFLLVHGILHLAGFDHQKTPERDRMEKAEAEILDKVKIHVER